MNIDLPVIAKRAANVVGVFLAEIDRHRPSLSNTAVRLARDAHQGVVDCQRSVQDMRTRLAAAVTLGQRVSELDVEIAVLNSRLADLSASQQKRATKPKAATKRKAKK